MDYTTRSSWITGAIVGVATWIALIIIYRLTIHPLAGYPGPWLAKISNLYTAYYSVIGQTHIILRESHKKYGPLVRLGPNKLAMDSPKAIHEIYLSKDVQKSKNYASLAANRNVFNLLTLIDKVAHRRKRRLVGQAFSEQSLRKFEPVIIHKAHVLLREISKAAENATAGDWSRPVDLKPHFRHLTLDILGEFGFGQSFDTQSSSKNHFFLDAIDAATFRGGVYIQCPELGTCGFDLLFLSIYGSLWARFIKLIQGLVNTRLTQKKDEKFDVFSLLVDAKDPETNQTPTTRDLFAESSLFVIAGTDTTASSLSATFFYLARNHACYERLVSLVRNKFSSVDDIKHTNTDLHSLLYLRACIDEAMRISPPIGQALWREVSNPTGITVDGVFVPRGVDVGGSIFCVHHNEDIFPESFKYRPERWMPGEGSSAEDIEKMKWAFQPFSLGSRKCLAMNMAYAEMMMVVAKALWTFDFNLIDGEDDAVFTVKEHLTAHYEGPYLQLKYRDGVSLDWEQLLKE